MWADAGGYVAGVARNLAEVTNEWPWAGPRTVSAPETHLPAQGGTMGQGLCSGGELLVMPHLHL